MGKRRQDGPDPDATRVIARPDLGAERTEVLRPVGTLAPPPSSGGGISYLVIRTAGELLITAGVVILLFVFYTLYVTNWTSAQKQEEVSVALDEDWSQQRQVHLDPIEGRAFARLYIPAFGADYRFSVVEGVTGPDLEVGPGHYPGTALPGEPGNVGVAGHRVGKGAPFNDLDLLEACDAIVVETSTDFFVYRVLPMPEQVADWDGVRAANPRCAKVPSLRSADAADGGPYGETVGRRIVTPDRGDAVAAVPYRPDSSLPKAQQAALLTLTTCHPRFSDRERMIIHAVLTNQESKSAGGSYAQLLTKIGEA